MEIKNLEALLQQFFNNNLTVTNYTTQQLTAAGENYGSQMLKVQIQIRYSKSKLEEETLNLVAKMSPPSQWLKEMFQTATTFKKEIAMYNIIFPTLKQFQKEQHMPNIIDFCPQCYGARVNLNPDSDVVDDNALLLLENLRLSDYETVDRMKGFDLETTKLILSDLAIFHAVPIALKLLKPNVFHKKILPHFQPRLPLYSLSEDAEQSIINLIVKTAKCNKECTELIPDVLKALRYSLENMKRCPLPQEPFATINHNDYWVNNTMIKFENNQPVKNKMVDFQLINYGSPGNDIVFFLFTSVQKEVLDLHYDDLIKLYYNKFVSTLIDLKCDVTPFTLELLQKEIYFSARTTQFFHVMDMLLPVFALKGKVKELHEMTEEDLVTEEQISDLYRRKVPEIILAFAKRNWIYV